MALMLHRLLTGSLKLTSAKLATVAFAATAASIALPATAASAAGATTYYVSPAGSDSNSGTSASSPIRTLGRASNLGLNPGDQVLLQSGATFVGKLAVWRSGTAAAPITISSYGGSAKPVVTGDCLEIGGSYITMTGLTVSGCTVTGIWSDGVGNVITGIDANHNIHGIDVGPNSQGARVTGNYLHNNDRMAPNRPGTFDDYGAVGVVVEGTNTEVSYNTINDNWAPSPDFGTDGSAVEIWGGVGTLVHHNLANNNRTFTELGNSRAANTTYQYNQVTSSLTDTEFLITRGDSDYFGPVRGTVAMYNTIKLTGARSLGFSCYAGCSAAYFTLSNNVFDVADRIGYVEGTMSGGNNIYWNGRTDGMKTMPGDRYTDPQFAPGVLVPSVGSPMVDAGGAAPMPTDLSGAPTGVDSNGDGVAGADIGAYEAGSTARLGAPSKSNHHNRCDTGKGKAAKNRDAKNEGAKNKGAENRNDRAEKKAGKSKCGSGKHGGKGKHDNHKHNRDNGKQDSRRAGERSHARLNLL